MLHCVCISTQSVLFIIPPLLCYFHPCDSTTTDLNHRAFCVWSTFVICPYACLCLCVHPQAKSERNYHIFYEMLAGLPPHEKRTLYLQEAETYYYLNQVHAPDTHMLRAHVRSGHCNQFHSLSNKWDVNFLNMWHLFYWVINSTNIKLIVVPENTVNNLWSLESPSHVRYIEWNVIECLFFSNIETGCMFLRELVD